MYFLSIYEIRRMKPVEMVARSSLGGERENDGRGEYPNKTYCMHICKYHNVTPVQLL
jgi:hypothetical protein